MQEGCDINSSICMGATCRMLLVAAASAECSNSSLSVKNAYPSLDTHTWAKMKVLKMTEATLKKSSSLLTAYCAGMNSGRPYRKRKSQNIW